MAVVIPHHHRGDLLPRTLAAVQGWPRVVVDDGPSGRPSPALPEDVLLLRTAGDQGFARAVNLGLATAESVLGAERVLLLNDDAVPEPGCVEAMLAAFGPQVGAVGPLLLGPQGLESAGIRLSRWGRVRQITQTPERLTQVGALSGACLLVPAWARFDPAFPHGFEDLALCRDLRARGLRVLVQPAARCLHIGGASLPRASRRAQRYAVAGHLRLVDGGWRGGIALGLALAQVLREGGPPDRLLGIAEGWADWRFRHREPPAGPERA